jgi:YfiH family protein
MTSRLGGVSSAPFDTLNLRPAGLRGDVADSPAAVAENERRLATALGAQPVWLNQVHGARVVRVGGGAAGAQLADLGADGYAEADASVSTDPAMACSVLVADCLPVLFASPDGRAVGAAHAGWRGLAAGVLENTAIAVADAAGCRVADVSAWLGACIGAEAFEVGPEVLQAYGRDPTAWLNAATGPAPPDRRFRYRPRADGSPRWRADLTGLARDRLAELGVHRIAGGDWCTVSDPLRFFSYRRDRVTGRMAACIRAAG